MTWWIPGAISAGSSLISASSQASQNNYQRSLNMYNAQMGYNVNMANAAAMGAAASANAQAIAKAGQMNAKLTMDVAMYNSELVWRVTQYNNALYENELGLLWDEVGLDVHNLEKMRAQERGGMRAAYASSGVVMDQDSAGDVIAAQMSQEYMDAFVIRHNGDVQASRILNAQAQDLWQGYMESQKILFEGHMGAIATEGNADLQAAAVRAEGAMMAGAARWSANQQLQADKFNAQSQFNTNQSRIGSDLMGGLFSAGSMAAGAYYQQKRPVVSAPKAGNIQTSGTSLLGGSSYQYQWKSGYTSTIY